MTSPFSWGSHSSYCEYYSAPHDYNERLTTRCWWGRRLNLIHAFGVQDAGIWWYWRMAAAKHAHRKCHTESHRQSQWLGPAQTFQKCLFIWKGREIHNESYPTCWLTLQIFTAARNQESHQYVPCGCQGPRLGSQLLPSSVHYRKLEWTILLGHGPRCSHRGWVHPKQCISCWVKRLILNSDLCDQPFYENFILRALPLMTQGSSTKPASWISWLDFVFILSVALTQDTRV